MKAKRCWSQAVRVWTPFAELVSRRRDVISFGACTLFRSELMDVQGVTALQALARLMDRGRFPEPCLAATTTQADRWRVQNAAD